MCECRLKLKTKLKLNQIFSITSDSLMKHTSSSMITSIARTQSSGDHIRQMKCSRGHCTLSKAQLGWQSQSMESVDHFGLRMMMGSLSLSIRSITLWCSIRSEGLFVLVVGCKVKSNGFNKIELLLTQQTSPWSGWIITFRIG